MDVQSPLRIGFQSATPVFDAPLLAIRPHMGNKSLPLRTVLDTIVRQHGCARLDARDFVDLLGVSKLSPAILRRI